MTLIAEPYRLPRLPGQQADVALGSPAAIEALFTEIIRERFRPGNGLAWVWGDNPTPLADELNDPDAPRKILIEPGFNENVEVRNFRPAIIIEKGETSSEKVVINNFAALTLPTSLIRFYSLCHIPLEISCVSDTKMESALLADLVWFYLLAGRNQIRETFGIHEVSNPTLGRSTPYDSDKTAWTTKVVTSLQVEFRWSTVPVAPLIQGVEARYRASGETNPDAYLLQQYIR